MSRKGFRRLLILGVAVGLVVAAFAVVTVVRGTMRDSSLLASRNEGIRLTEEGAYEAGLLELSPYVGRVKDDYDALVAYAKCRSAVPEPNNKHLIGAIEAAKLAANTAPQRPEAHAFLIAIYAKVGRQTELLDSCEAMLAIDPTNEIALAQRVAALVTLDRLDRAAEEADAYIAAQPGSLLAYGARADVLRARGTPPGAIHEYLSGDPVAEILRDHPEYQLALVDSAARALDATGDPEGVYAQQAIDAALRAASMTPDTPELAARITAHLRQLAMNTGDDSLAALADDTADRYSAMPSLADGFAALESRAAWWRLDDARAVDFAGLIDAGSAEVGALGWRRLIAVTTKHDNGGRSIGCEGCAAGLAEAGVPVGAYWNAIADAFEQIVADGEAKPILDALNTADDQAPILDALSGSADHTQLVALGRGMVYLQNAQLDSARASLEANAVGRFAPPRLRLLLAEVCSQQGDADRASELVVQLMRENIDTSMLMGVDRRYQNRRLASPNIADAQMVARRSLETVEAMVEGDPENPAILATYARFLMTAGETQRGLEVVDRVLTLDAPNDLTDLIQVAQLIDPIDRQRSRALLDLPSGEAVDSLVLVSAKAAMVARDGNPQAGLALFDEVRAETPAALVKLGIARLDFMEDIGHTGILDAMRALSDDHPGSASAQTAVIASPVAWDHEPLIRNAVARLRDATDEDAIDWRIADLRADLAFLENMPEADRGTALSEVILRLTEISRRAPQNTSVLRLIALAYDRAGQPDDAIRTLRRSVTRTPVAYPDLITVLIRDNRLREAGNELQSFLAIPHNDLTTDLIRSRADLLDFVGRTSDGLPDRILLARNGLVSDVAALGFALAQTGDAAGAANVAARLTEGNPSPDAVRSAGRIMLEAGLPDRAAEVYLDSMPGLTPAEKHAELGRMFLASSDWDRASVHLQRSIELGGGDVPDGVRLTLAHTLLEAGDIAGARGALTDATGEDADSLRAAIAAATGHVHEPGAMLARVLAAALVSERELDTLIAAAISGHFAGETDIESLVSALASLAGHPGAAASQILWKSRVALARATDTRNGDDAALIAILEETADRLGDAWPLRELALAHISAGRFDDAEDAAGRLAAAPGADAYAADAIRARIAAGRGRLADALFYLLPHRDRLAADVTNPVSAAVFATALAATDRAGEAESFIEARLVGDPNAIWLFRDAAGVIADHDTARRWLERVGNSTRADDRRLDLGLAWAALSERSEDANDADRAFEVLSGLPDTEINLPLAVITATLEHKAGRPSAAATRFGGLLATHPDDVLLLNNYAFLLATDLDRADDARRYIEHAIEIAKEEALGPDAFATLQHTLGVVYRRAGRPEDAERALTLGLEIAGPSAELVIELAEVLLEGGRGLEVEALLERLPDTRSLGPGLGARVERLRNSLP